MFEPRPLRWPDDRGPLLALDTSFTTERVYRVERAGDSFALVEARAEPPLRKSYPLADEIDALAQMDWVRVVEGADGAIVGVAAVRVEKWNRRAVLQHLYVAPHRRGAGVGRALVAEALAEARRVGARCLWAETQTVNFDAVRFYLSAGFVWCGLDTSLYDPAEVGEGEVALFFSRDVS